ncbi:MAG: hypothetical protein ACJ77N_13105 [Chloroflexota bacterium]
MDLRALARPSGALAMVALDQRESLRTIVAERSGRELDAVSDGEIRRLKAAIAAAVTPHASAILLDTRFGLEPVREAAALAPSCALILAADELEQEPGMPVEETDLDEAVDVDAIDASGAVALKLLVLWRGEGSRPRLESIVLAFLDRCRRARVLSVLEAVVRPPRGVDAGSWDREAAILDAAQALSPLGPDLYKAEVPLHGRGDQDEIHDRCIALDAAIGRPWVLLSQGVDVDDFPAAVDAACRAGASGFLAGRAIWTDSIGPGGEDELRSRLEEIAVPRLRQLGELVDRIARPVGVPI